MSKRNMTILAVVVVGGFLLYQMSKQGQNGQGGQGGQGTQGGQDTQAPQVARRRR